MHYVGGADTEDQQKNHVSILKYTELLISQPTYHGWGWIIKEWMGLHNKGMDGAA